MLLPHSQLHHTAGLASSLGILLLLDSAACVLLAPMVPFANGKCFTHLPLCEQEVSPGPPMHLDCTQARGVQKEPYLPREEREASIVLGLHPDCHLALPGSTITSM